MNNTGDFFWLSSKLRATYFHAPPIGLSKLSEKDDPKNHLITGDYKAISFPVVFKQTAGKKDKIFDMIDTGFVSLFLISTKFRDILIDNNLTGWTTYDINLSDNKNNRMEGYYGFSIVGKCGPINYEKSEIIEKRFVPEGPIVQLYKGTHFGEDEWDGRDFFLPKDNSMMILTSKAYKALKGGRLSNTCMGKLSEEETMVSMIKIRYPECFVDGIYNHHPR